MLIIGINRINDLLLPHHQQLNVCSLRKMFHTSMDFPNGKHRVGVLGWLSLGVQMEKIQPVHYTSLFDKLRKQVA